MTPVSALPHVKVGRLRPLGVTTRQESRHVPGTKPFAEQGFESTSVQEIVAAAAAAGLPVMCGLLERYNSAVVTAARLTRDPALLDRMVAFQEQLAASARSNAHRGRKSLAAHRATIDTTARTTLPEHVTCSAVVIDRQGHDRAVAP